ncbi:MAG: DsbA family protein [Bacteroidetes bacterium]|nr:MAG: DsbA family protein [Bacteroidota bacterium]
MNSTIWYIGDPLCSWCWGFSPQFEQLMDALKGEAQLRIRMGGLRPGTREVMDERLKSFLSHHWHEVHHRSGQPFSFDIMKRDDFVYDTEPPCRAVIVMRHLQPAKEWAFFKAIQYAFYAQNKDTNQTATYLPLVEELGVDWETFREKFESDTFKKKSWQEFAEVAELGIRGFPSVLLQTSGRVHPITLGYMQASLMLERARAFMNKTVS